MNNIKAKGFELFSSNSRFTDESVLTIATMDSVINGKIFYESYDFSVEEFNRRPRDVVGRIIEIGRGMTN